MSPYFPGRPPKIAVKGIGIMSPYFPSPYFPKNAQIRVTSGTPIKAERIR